MTDDDTRLEIVRAATRDAVRALEWASIEQEERQNARKAIPRVGAPLQHRRLDDYIYTDARRLYWLAVRRRDQLAAMGVCDPGVEAEVIRRRMLLHMLAAQQAACLRRRADKYRGYMYAWRQCGLRALEKE